MRIKTSDITSIRAGKSKMFSLPDAKACHSARSLVCYVKRCSMPTDVSDYKTEIDWQQNIIRVTAIPK